MCICIRCKQEQQSGASTTSIWTPHPMLKSNKIISLDLLSGFPSQIPIKATLFKLWELIVFPLQFLKFVGDVWNWRNTCLYGMLIHNLLLEYFLVVTQPVVENDVINLILHPCNSSIIRTDKRNSKTSLFGENSINRLSSRGCSYSIWVCCTIHYFIMLTGGLMVWYY